ncbi:unnamed protein product [Caenorhabditis brenneri]
MYSGENLGDQEVPAHGAASGKLPGHMVGESAVQNEELRNNDTAGPAPREHRAARQRRRQRHDQQRPPRPLKVPYQCKFCRVPLNADQFVAHMEVCPAALRNPDKTLEIINNFRYNPEFFHHQLTKLKEKCELSFLEAKLDPRKRVDMACRLCKSADDHFAGRCMADEQKAVFELEAKKIADQVLLHLELKPDLNQLEFENYKKLLKDKIEAVANEMNAYITSKTKNFRKLRQVVAERRAQPTGEQSGSGVQGPSVRMGEAEVAELERFFANVKIPGAQEPKISLI